MRSIWLSVVASIAFVAGACEKKSADSGGAAPGAAPATTEGAAASAPAGSAPAAPAPAGDGAYKQSDDPENLKGLLDTIVKASEGGDTKKAAALTRGIIPDEAALKKALRDDAPPAFVSKLNEQIKHIPPEDAQVAGLFRRGEANRTEIKVHGATTEEIKAYAKDSVAEKEFPGGAKKLAEVALRPNVKFYEVEFTAPGEDLGMKYHLFFWDGASWRMLGPAWRGIE
jgi:hypothetical protein